MYERKTKKQYSTPFEHALELFGNKWNGRVLGILHLRPNLRYGDIKRLLPGITDPVLSSVLKLFQKEEIIIRTQKNELPIRVEYSLTERGWELVELCQKICSWSCKYYPRDVEEEYIYCVNCELNPLTEEEKARVNTRFFEDYKKLMEEKS